MCNFGFAQDKVTANEVSIQITLSDDQSAKAKSLKSIEFGELYKGIDRNTFLIRTEEQNIESLKSELTKMFPDCKLERKEDR